MDISEPSDKTSSAWRNWALMQVGQGGRPRYRVNEETGALEDYITWEYARLGGTND